MVYICLFSLHPQAGDMALYVKNINKTSRFSTSPEVLNLPDPRATFTLSYQFVGYMIRNETNLFKCHSNLLQIVTNETYTILDTLMPSMKNA
jgi:hypothetical protein